MSSRQEPGYYAVTWSGADDHGWNVASRTCYYVLKTDGRMAQQRIPLVG